MTAVHPSARICAATNRVRAQERLAEDPQCGPMWLTPGAGPAHRAGRRAAGRFPHQDRGARGDRLLGRVVPLPELRPHFQVVAERHPEWRMRRSTATRPSGQPALRRALHPHHHPVASGLEVARQGWRDERGPAGSVGEPAPGLRPLHEAADAARRRARATAKSRGVQAWAEAGSPGGTASSCRPSTRTHQRPLASPTSLHAVGLTQVAGVSTSPQARPGPSAGPCSSTS